jgi:hypothetical protein
MNTIGSIDLSEIVSGPDLILRNAFRLAQMPVDCAERALNKRQKMIEMAKKMEMPIPSGQSPVFTVQEGDGYDDLKEALHRIRDPFNRLFAEIFWFWPQTFGASDKDQGLKLLAGKDIKQTLKFWQQAELELENHVSTHNLAVLHQFIALQIDDQMIAEKVSPNGKKKKLFNLDGHKDDQKARKHWKESYNKWMLLTRQDSFWDFIKRRIKTIDDPRLPPDSGDWIRSNITGILFSINAGLALRAAEYGLGDSIVRQRRIMADSGFSPEEIEKVFEKLTRKYRQRATYLCKTVENEVKRNPVEGQNTTLNFIDQATPLLQFLANIYPDGNKAVDVLHDEVAETILRCQVAYSNKTENWDVSIKLLKTAEPIARGNDARTRITDNLKIVRELKEDGNNWCDPGYFELPPECIDWLEKARVFQGAEKFDDAIGHLRNALLGIADLPGHPEFRKHLVHCIAYCLKRKSVLTYNRALDEFNRKAEKMLIDSLICDGHISPNYVICAGCRGNIYGQYTIRTIRGHKFPFCHSCNGKVEREFKKLTSSWDKTKKESLDLIVLAYALDPGFKSVATNLAIMEKSARDSNIKKSSPESLKKSWNLVEPHELITDLMASSGSSTDKIFSKLVKLILQQSHRQQAFTLKQFASSMVKKRAAVTNLLPACAGDNYILNAILKYALALPADSAAFVKGICDIVDFRLKFDLINKIEKLLEDPIAYTDPIVASLNKDFEQLMSSAHDAKTLFTKQVFDFLNFLAAYNEEQSDAYVRQICNKLIIESKALQITQSIHSIRENASYMDIFFTELSSITDRMPSGRIPIVYLAIYQSIDGKKADISRRLGEHISQFDDPLGNAEIGKFMIFLLKDSAPEYRFAFKYLKKNCERAIRSILLATVTTDPRQAERLAVLIDTYLGRSHTPDNVDADLMVKSLLAASFPKLSQSLMQLIRKVNPEFEKMFRKKRVIRDLKYLVQKTEGIQKKTAESILQQERQKGLLHRINIWQWRPAKTFKMGKAENIWWAKD